MVTFHESTAWFGMAVLHLAWHPVPGLGVTGVTWIIRIGKRPRNCHGGPWAGAPNSTPLQRLGYLLWILGNSWGTAPMIGMVYWTWFTSANNDSWESPALIPRFLLIFECWMMIVQVPWHAIVISTSSWLYPHRIERKRISLVKLQRDFFHGETNPLMVSIKLPFGNFITMEHSYVGKLQ